MATEIRHALSSATRVLAEVSDTPRLDAELLMAHALGVDREVLLMHMLSRPMPANFAALLDRRLTHEPVAYITGRRDFWTIALRVNPAVLIPRPDSETLIEAAVAYFGSVGPARVLDLGTGSGALLLAALAQWPTATGLGIDVSPAALGVAADNAAALGLGDRSTFAVGNWADGVTGTYDLILCNPPYVETSATLARGVADFEPAGALYAGADGLDDYRVFIPQLAGLVRSGGMIAVEIGSAQAMAVTRIFETYGLAVRCAFDLGGRPRALLHFALGFGSQPH